MTQEELVARINALAAKAKAEGLTEEETNERMKLREEYLIRFRKGLHQQLDNTYVVGPDGVKRKLLKIAGVPLHLCLTMLT